MDGYTYWDLGEVETIRMSDTMLAKIMRALLTLKGRLVGSQVFNDGNIKPRYHSVSMRISLPDGTLQKFIDMTGLIPTSIDTNHSSTFEVEKKPYQYRSSNLIVSDDPQSSYIPNFD